MNEKQDSAICPRCQTENRIEHNFCWLCGIGLREPVYEQQVQNQTQNGGVPVGVSVGSSVGAGIGGVLVGAMGGIVVGVMIVIAFILAIFNAIAEIFEGCAAMLAFMGLTFFAAIYSIVSWLF